MNAFSKQNFGWATVVILCGAIMVESAIVSHLIGKLNDVDHELKACRAERHDLLLTCYNGATRLEHQVCYTELKKMGAIMIYPEE